MKPERIQTLFSRLGISHIKMDSDLLKQALTHRSVRSEQNHSGGDNERLEFLGDAILKASISEWLYRYCPDFSEGEMSQIRGYVVSDAALSQVARAVGLDAWIILGTTEKVTGGRFRESILANVFEALCGAVFLSSDYRSTARMILTLIEPELKRALKGEAEEVLNYKALLQEYIQAEHKALPEYHLQQTEGPQHQRRFFIEARLGEQSLGQGEGTSKKRAEQEAAKVALSTLDALPAPRKVGRNAEQFFAKEPPQKRLLAPSILAADFSRLSRALYEIESGGAPWVHLDVMDGHFVPNLTLGPPVIASLRPLTSMFFDAHLMMTHPQDYIPEFVKAGCDHITVHVEVEEPADKLLKSIASYGIGAGLSLNPGTPVEAVEPYLEDLSLVLVMSVNPGFGGQKFMPNSLDKIRQLVRWRSERGLDFKIQVDGGINDATVSEVLAAGADVLVMGSAVFKAADVVARTREMVNLINAPLD